MTTETDQTYNGHANRETWAASLHLSNDQGLYLMCEEAAANAWAAAEHAPYVETTEDRYNRAVSILADFLSDDLFGEWADAMEAGGDPGPVARMAVREVGSLWRVEWRDVATPYVDTAREGEEA